MYITSKEVFGCTCPSSLFSTTRGKSRKSCVRPRILLPTSGKVSIHSARTERLIRQERLLRMGEMTASIAHELNQPLTSILSNAQAALRLLQMGKLRTAELEEILQDIAKDDRRAGDIIRSLRSMVKVEEGEKEQININNLVTDVISLMHSEAVLRNMTIETNCDNSLPQVTCHKVQIQQVMINLMLNAAEATSRVSGNKKIVVTTCAGETGGVRVAVRDFGTGLGEGGESTMMFEPFFTTKRTGLGMGLFLSRSIIESHGGRVWAENNSDHGASFYFTLPDSGIKAHQSYHKA